MCPEILEIDGSHALHVFDFLSSFVSTLPAQGRFNPPASKLAASHASEVGAGNSQQAWVPHALSLQDFLPSICRDGNDGMKSLSL